MLDIGSGNGGLVWLLRQGGYSVTASDVANKSRIPSVQPILLGAGALPFPSESFDTVLLITVLHHTRDPETLLREALRVTRNKLIILEDVYNNALQKHITYWADSLVNHEWRHHPHSNSR